MPVCQVAQDQMPVTTSTPASTRGSERSPSGHAQPGRVEPTAVDRGIVSFRSTMIPWWRARTGGFVMMQAAHSRQTRNLSILLEVSNALASQVRLDELLATIISKTAEVLDAERATLFLYDPAQNELWSKTADQLEIKEIRLAVGQGIAGDVARTRRVENIPDVYADPRFNREFDRRTGYRTRSILSIPLIGAHDELVGVIQVLNKKNRARFDQEDESLLRGLSAH